jgi:3-hydroxyisobutyrate dehydrogenase-like beta-hydroxyacid dehydrogenase
MEVGFIGIGHMGRGMALNLIKAGHAVCVYNRTESRARELVAAGARFAATVREACDADVLITMVSNDGALESILFGDDGALNHLSREGIHLSMSTISIGLSERLASAHHDKSQQFVAAPVFGRPEAAAAGKLFILAGGAATALARLEPLFAAMGQKTFKVSETPRDANLLKICGNFMIASVSESLGEAIALVRKAGIPAQTFVEVLTSTLFSAPIYKTYGALIANQQYSPPGFAAPLGAKDIGLALAAAESLGASMPLGYLLRDRFARLLKEGGESLDWSAIAKLSADDAGLGGS